MMVLSRDAVKIMSGFSVEVAMAVTLHHPVRFSWPPRALECERADAPSRVADERTLVRETLRETGRASAGRLGVLRRAGAHLRHDGLVRIEDAASDLGTREVAAWP